MIDFIIQNSILDEENLNYTLLFGDFENDKPVYSDANNDFFIYENNCLFKHSGKKVFSVFSLDKETDMISQGEIINDAINGKAALFDSKGKIYYSGEFADGVYKGIGSLIIFDSEDHFSKFILIRGDFDKNEIINARVYFFQDKNTDKILVVENAVLSMKFEIKYGKINFDSEEYYEGYLHNYSKHGKGKYVYSNGSYYDGEWNNDKKHGEGVYIDADKREIKGTWVDDRFQN